MTNATDTNDFHFFAASCVTWATTTDKRDLPALIDLMNREGYTYNLFLVPVHHAVPYDIEFYQPKVQGTQFLGAFQPKRRNKRAA